MGPYIHIYFNSQIPGKNEHQLKLSLTRFKGIKRGGVGEEMIDTNRLFLSPIGGARHIGGQLDEHRRPIQ